MFPENPGGKGFIGPQPGTVGCPGILKNWDLMGGIRGLGMALERTVESFSFFQSFAFWP